MRKLVFACAIAGSIASQATAQTLFTYGGKPVSKAEFLRVYQKNSLNKKPDFSDTALRSYLDLYAIFRMKVAEAENMHLDTLQSIGHELDNYRRQLARNYLTDQQVTNTLVREAYDRQLQEVHVAHIMVALTPSSTDTVAAHNRIDSIYNALTKKGADFAATAKAVSDDKGSRDRGGDIGYMTGLQTLYAFENAVYNTSDGTISKPFRTQFGYHIIKVLGKRPARGEVKVAHILLATPKSQGETGVATARRRLDSLERDLKAGKNFDDLVAHYSEDKFTVNDKGVMQPFGVGRMVPAFEDAAFALKKPGDISQPIQTEYGFHVIKLIEKYPAKPFDSVRDALKRRVENDSRSQQAHDQFIAGIKKKNGYKEFPENLKAVSTRLMSIPDTGRTANTFKAEDYKDMIQPVFQMAGKTYTQADFINFMQQMTRGRLTGAKSGVISDLYRMYVDRTVNDYEEHHLAEENEDFRNLMDEYRNGIMLFELMDRNVWGKASKDTAGLTAFYEKNKAKYQWEPGFSGAVYRFKNEEAYNKATVYLAKNPKAKDEDLTKELNTDKMPDAVTVQRGHYEFSQYKEIPRNNIAAGAMSKGVRNSDGSYTAVRADEILNSPSQKTLDEARGYAVADYQDYLEKQWNTVLKTQYPVKVDETVFKSMEK